MYTRKIYEPESKLRIQIPGHGVGSTAGSTAQQEVWVRPTQTRLASNGSSGTKRNVTEIRPGEYTIVTRRDPFSTEDRHGAAVEKMVALADQRMQQQITDTKKRLDALTEERNALPVLPRSSKPDLATVLFGRGSAAPNKEEMDRAAELDMKILEAEEALIQYEEQVFRRDVVKLYGQAGIDGWDQYLQYKEDKENADAERMANETWLDKLGRYMSGNTRDTTLPFHVDEIQLAEGHRAQERGKREPDDRWTNVQKAEFGYLWGSSPERAGNYAAQLNKRLDTEEAAAEIEMVREWSTKSPVNGALGTVGSILLSAPAGMADLLNDVTAYGTLGYIPKSDGSADLWDVTQATTSAISEKMNSWGTLPKEIPVLGDRGLGDVYGLGVDVIQSYLAVASGGPAQAAITFIGPAAAAAKDDALRRGADDETALTYGAVMGLIEAGAEAIGAENVTRLISSGGLKALLSSPGMGEAIEEGAASLAGFLADVLLMRENSEFSRRVTEYEEEGKTRASAVANAAWDTLEDILYDSLAGGLSGEAHAGIAKVWSAVSKALGDKGKTSNAGTQEKAPSNATMPYGGPGPRTKPPITDTMAKADIRDGDTSVPSRAEAPKTAQPEGDVPYFTSDHWTGELEGLWTENTADTVDTGTVDRQQPLRYEDALREYVGQETKHSRDPVTPQTAVPVQGSPVVDDSTQRTVQRPKDQVIGELAPKLQKPGITPGRAMIAAQETYADAEKRFGSNTPTVLEMLQPGQEPRRFLDGFQNAYILGKQGAGPNVLKNSTAAAYLTDSQQAEAYALGEQVRRGLENGGKGARIAPDGVAADPNMPYAVPLRRDVKKAIIERGIKAKDTIFTYDTAQNPLATYAKRIPKQEGFYDVVMHGTDTAVWFFETKIDAYTLAQIIRQRPDYKKGTPIRLLSCNTGNTKNTGNCVAQLLANELGATVIAPNLKLYVYPDGKYTVGRKDEGEMKRFTSRKVDKFSEVYYCY